MSAFTLAFAETYGFWKLLAILIGRLHVVLLHFPVGLLIAAGVLEVWAWWRGRSLESRASGKPAGLDAAAGACLWLGAAAAVVTTATGWVNAAQGGSSDLIELHRWTGTAAAVVAVVALMLRAAASNAERQGRVRSGVGAAYRVMVAVGAAAVAIAGHFGGSITHGSG